MKSPLRFATLRAVRTLVQNLAGVAATVPAVSTVVDARAAAIVAGWGAVGAVIGALVSFLQNLAEALEAAEDAEA